MATGSGACRRRGTVGYSTTAVNAEAQANCVAFKPADFLAAVTQHIPDGGFHLVRFYGWYSNKMRGSAPGARA